MGHWSDDLRDEVLEQLGPGVDRQTAIDALAFTGREVDILSGRTFQGVQQSTTEFEPNGLPFVDVPNVHVGSLQSARDIRAIADPVNPEHAEVMQLLRVEVADHRAAPVADALSIAGQLIAQMSQAGALSRDYVLHWLHSRRATPEQIQKLFRRVMDPAVRFYVPVLGAAYAGWWFQIARRLMWVTRDTENDGHLVEMLLPDEAAEGGRLPLVASEPVLIAARIVKHPADYAFVARIWTEGAVRPTDRSWSMFAKAIHGHGTPTITVDPNSTPMEVACQVILKGYWHGYLDGSEHAIARAVSAAYPGPVGRLLRHTDAPDIGAAGAVLLEQLVHPGFDPAQGAEATRRYVRRKASIAIMEHRKREHPSWYPWTQVGITERRFYKLLPLFSEKINGRYDYDQDKVVARMRAHLDKQDDQRTVRAAAMDVLLDHGFKSDAARKWLQRHPVEEVVGAWPRGSNRGRSQTRGGVRT